MSRISLMTASALALALNACTSETPAADTPRASDAEAHENAGLYKLTPVAEGLEYPWGMTFVPGRQRHMLVTERDGTLNLVKVDGTVLPVSGGPSTYAERQGGYLGLVVDPEFDKNRLVYLAYAKGDDDANSTAIFKAELSQDGTELLNGEDIYQADLRDTAFHFGGRMQFLADGTLVLGLGDGFKYMKDAQDTSNTHGTIIRIHTDGSIPDDNPLVGVEGAAEEVYSWGHRNIQGLLYDVQTDTLFAHEHGPKGGDELNVIEPGKNYGWPEITYGVNYDGTIISRQTSAEGMEQPIAKWVPSIAPSGMIRYTGGLYPGWAGGILIGAINGPAGQKLVHLELDGQTVIGEHHYLTDLERPIRDIAQGIDGFVYVLTHEPEGGLYRIEPVSSSS